LEYCFKELNLRKINLGVVIENTSAYNLYKNIGFELEGIFKEHGLYQGKYCDIARMAIFNKRLRISEK
jgi:RimJ/RimL family protein N-acetyltransferase